MSYLTSRAVAEELHVRVETVWQYIRTGELPAARVGRQYLVDPEDLADFVNRRMVEDTVAAAPALDDDRAANVARLLGDDDLMTKTNTSSTRPIQRGRTTARRAVTTL